MRPTHFTVGSTIYWTIHTYSQDGQLTDADSNPAVEVSKNGVATIDAVSVSRKRVGTYLCQYTPSGAAEGDTYSFEEDATLGSDSYVNGWALVANAPERGTDGANTVAPVDVSSDVTAILADTNELQGNQGDWATATTVVASNMRGTDNALLASDAPTNWSDMLINGDGKVTTSNPAAGGGSQHTAQDVANLILVTPANKLATDGNGDVTANNMRGTDGANTVTPVDVSGAIAALNDFDPASDLVTTDSASRNASKADVSGLASQSSVDAVESKVDTLVADSSGWGTADVSGLATQASVDVIDGNVDDVKSAIANTVIPNQVVSSGLMINVKAVTDKVDTMLQVDGSNFQYTVDALALAPTGSGGGGTGASSAEIYNYFTSNGREVVFQADVSGLSTFDPAADQVTAGNMVAEAPTESEVYNYFTSGSREDQFKANVSGLSTLDSGDVTNAVTSSLNSYDAAKGSEITSAKNEIVSDIAGLNNFDPAYDTVSNVNTVQTVINGGSGGGGGDATAANQTVILSAINDLNDFDPNSDVVQNVNTVQTVINGGGSGGGGGGTITVKATPTPRAF